ncbi:hypothetical protein KAT08_01675 [Candidatus Babeliales bacterium]|nr:hypothetical protein [Candidatus Babeliales bacterium]
MRKRLTKLALAGILVASVMQATEFRSPWLSERGPLRYKFEKGDPDRYSLDFYSFTHRREAHKAFLSHSTDTHPLTALFFNKADFALNEIFYNSAMDTNAINYNPFMNIMKIHPRATYYEWGADIGCRFEYPVYQDKGRIGFRLNIPFRLIEIERENITDKLDDTVEDYILPRHVTVETGVASAGTANVLAKAYNLGFINKLIYTSGGARKNALERGNNQVDIFGTKLALWDVNDAKDKSIQGLKMLAGIIYNEAGKKVPNEPDSPLANYHWAFNAGDTEGKAIGDRQKHWVKEGGDPNNANADGYDKLRKISFFTLKDSGGNPQDYSTISATKLDEMWLVLGYDNGILPTGAKNIADGVDNVIAQYLDDPYQWLLTQGNYGLETDRRTGFGDIDLDIFYEHMFSDEWVFEGMLGVRFPTGSDDDYTLNPFKAHLGNGEHFEIKIGLMAAWQPISWMNVKLDSYFSFVLEATEKRCAVFEGSQIKNMGPVVNADVDWQYLVARLDFNFFHLKNKRISGLLGYEFYFKTEDDIDFKSTQMQEWSGAYYGTVAQAALEVPAVTDLELKKNLSNKLAEKNTEAIGHKIRTEGRYQVNPWFELMAGGSYTFAGKNLPRETDIHAGWSIRF